MAMLLKGATLIDLEPASVERADLRIEGELIVERATTLVARPGDEIFDFTGKLLFPGLVSAHHHFYASLLRGAPRTGSGFTHHLQALHRLEQVLDQDELQAATTAGALEGLLAGTTTVFDVHTSPNCLEGSLSRVAHGLSEVGLRAVLGYQVSERAGSVSRESAIDENLTFLARAGGRFRGALAVESLATLSDEALGGLREAQDHAQCFFLATLAEDPLEEEHSRTRFEASATERLLRHGLIGERTVLAQAVHLSWPELSQVINHGTWVAHAPRSNMHGQTGLATASKFGIRACLGTDVMPLDVFAEAQIASLRAMDSGQPIDAIHFLANGHRLATEAFGLLIGPLQPGAVADLLVLDYASPTPLDASTLAAHVLLGLGGRTVESVMVDGLWRAWKRKPTALDAAEVSRHAVEAARAVWKKMNEAT